MKIENVELERNKCKEFIQNNLNVQVTDSNLHSLLMVCKTNKIRNAVINEIVGNIECNPNVSLSEIKKPLVALASFPGSGNTMTRRIVEILTGNIEDKINPLGTEEILT